MLVHLEGYQSQSVISELLLLIGTGSISISSLALGVLASVESRHLLRHTVLLMVSCTFKSMLSKLLYAQVFYVYRVG
jgi:hypothetical protein